MKFTSLEFFSYCLFPRKSCGSRLFQVPREGFLLKVQFQDGKIGYSDCFPWLEYGDLPRQQQLDHLKIGLLTSLTERSFYFARKDAEARSSHQSLFKSLILPPSHILTPSVQELNEEFLESSSRLGYRLIKLKVGSDIFHEAACIRSLFKRLEFYRIKLRLDFNSSLVPAELDLFLKLLGPSLSEIDFIEDPFTWNPKTWREAQNKWKVRFALDWISLEELRKVDEPFFSVLVLKPARQEVHLWLKEVKRLGVSGVVTSSLDHPLGQLSAAWVAGRIQQKNEIPLEVCGLVSHLVYQSHPFSEALQVEASVLKPPEDDGFGLTSLLKGLDWKPLRGK